MTRGKGEEDVCHNGSERSVEERLMSAVESRWCRWWREMSWLVRLTWLKSEVEAGGRGGRPSRQSSRDETSSSRGDT